jgi:hypothetical protein
MENEIERIYRIEKRALELSTFARSVMKVVAIDDCEEQYKMVGKKKVKMTQEEMIEKFKIKATGMIENLLDIISKQ